MQGKTHSMMGLAGGLWAPAGAAWVARGVGSGWLSRASQTVVGPVEGLVFGLATAGFSIIPDWDTGRSLGATMWGPVSQAVTAPIRAVTGHRGLTHNPVVAPLVLALFLVPMIGSTVVAFIAGLLVWLLGLFLPVGGGFVAAVTDAHALIPWVGAVSVAVTVGLALAGLAVSLPPGPWRWWPVNLAVSVGAGFLSFTTGWVPAWLPWAAVLGVLVHIVGDKINEWGLPYGGSVEYLVWLGCVSAVVAWVDTITGLGVIPALWGALSEFARSLLSLT